MKLKDAVIAWNPQSADVEVGLLAGSREWARRPSYCRTTGAVFVHVRDFEGLEAGHYLMSEFIGLVIRDGVNLQAAYREFMKIDEFREAVPADLEYDWYRQNKKPRRD